MKFVDFLKSRQNFYHISPADISKSKTCFNATSSTSYFQIKAKALADFQIYIGVPLMKQQMLHKMSTATY